MKPQTIKKLIFGALLLGALAAKADDTAGETWNVDGKTFTDKGAAIRYVVSNGKRVNVVHTRCEILTNKLTFKACPKNKQTSFENEQFDGLKVSK